MEIERTGSQVYRGGPAGNVTGGVRIDPLFAPLEYPTRSDAERNLNGDTPMTTWTRDELDRIGTADELQVNSIRRDDTLEKPVTIWVVCVGGDLYVRSVHGRGSAWFRGTQVRREGRIRAGGVEKDVNFQDADEKISDQIDLVYRTKYCRYSASYVDAVVSPKPRAATIKLLPRS